MTPVEEIRAAAQLMRQRADAASYPPWEWDDAGQGKHADVWSHTSVTTLVAADVAKSDAVHMASWHPGVALAVADWLDIVAKYYDESPDPVTNYASIVARAYLGGAT